MGKLDTVLALGAVGAMAYLFYRLFQFGGDIGKSFSELFSVPSKIISGLTEAHEKAREAYVSSPYTPAIYKPSALENIIDAQKLAAAKAQIAEFISTAPQPASRPLEPVAYEIATVTIPTPVYQSIQSTAYASALSKLAEQKFLGSPVH